MLLTLFHDLDHTLWSASCVVCISCIEGLILLSCIYCRHMPELETVYYVVAYAAMFEMEQTALALPLEPPTHAERTIYCHLSCAPFEYRNISFLYCWTYWKHFIQLHSYKLGVNGKRNLYELIYMPLNMCWLYDKQWCNNTNYIH